MKWWQRRERIWGDQKKVIGGRKAKRKVKLRQNQKQFCKRENLKNAYRRQAELRTQTWRLRIKLGGITKVSKNACPGDSQPFAKDQTGEHPSDQVFSSYLSERRMVAEVKDVLPSTPAKKAWIIEHLNQSPNTSKILEKKGIIITPETHCSLEIGSAIVHEWLKQSKPKGGCRVDLLRSYKQMKALITDRPVSAIARSLPFIKQYFHFWGGLKLLKAKWWDSDVHKRRKDRLTDEVSQRIRDFFLLKSYRKHELRWIPQLWPKMRWVRSPWYPSTSCPCQWMRPIIHTRNTTLITR